MSADPNAMQALLAQQLMARGQGGMVGGNQQAGMQQAGGQVANTGMAQGVNGANSLVQQIMLARALRGQPPPQMPPGGNPTGQQPGVPPMQSSPDWNAAAAQAGVS